MRTPIPMTIYPPKVENEVTSFCKSNALRTDIQGLLGKEDSVVTNSLAAEWIKGERKYTGSKREDLICINWMNIDMVKLVNTFRHSLSIDATHKAVKIDGLSLLPLEIALAIL